MPKIKCYCGNIIRLGEIPNPKEWLIISDEKFDKFGDTVITEELYRSMKSMLLCEKCHRIWIYWDGFENSPRSYMPEE